MESKNEHKTLLILDLDETLMHGREKPLEQKEAFRVDHFYIYWRPFLKTFLKEIKDDFLVAVWSSASDDSPEKTQGNYGNAIYPNEFTGSPEDDELLYLLKYLKTLKDKTNVRGIEKRGWRSLVEAKLD